MHRQRVAALARLGGQGARARTTELELLASRQL